MRACAAGDSPVKHGGRSGREQEEIMRALGYATAVTLAAAGVALGVLVVMSLPDLRRHLAMRKM